MGSSEWYSHCAPVLRRPLEVCSKGRCGGGRPPLTASVSVFQIITALEEDGTAQKMQLGYRLQQIAAAVENKVTDL